MQNMEECVHRTWMPQHPAKVNRGITLEQKKDMDASTSSLSKQGHNSRTEEGHGCPNIQLK